MAFNKAHAAIAFPKTLTLLFFFATMSGAHAEGGVVTATGSGKDIGEATASLLKTTVHKNFKSDPALVTTILQNEILPNASSFVQSYKMGEGSSSVVNLNADVDLDVLRGLFSLTPKGLGEAGTAKAVVVVRGAKLPQLVAKPDQALPDPFLVLESACADRFQRRKFEVTKLKADEISALGAGDDVSGAEFLRGVGSKEGARLALGLSGKWERVRSDGEHAHGEEDRVFLTATLVDVSTGAMLGHATASFLDPKSRKEAYLADVQRALLEESKELLQDIFVSAGKRMFTGAAQDGFTVIRVAYPSNPMLVTKFRSLVEGLKGVKTVVEFKIRRGSFDLALRPSMDPVALTKAIQGFSSEEITVEMVPASAGEQESVTPAVFVKLAPKVVAQPTAVPPVENERR